MSAATKGKRIKTPTILQMEAVECGAASLAIILAHFKRYVPLEELRMKCGVSRDGSKANNILKAARGYGLDAKGYKHAPAEVAETPMPCVVWWNQNHFLVVEGVVDGMVYLNDPASGPRKVPFEEFSDCYSYIVLVFTPGPEFQRGGVPPSLLAGLIPRMKPFKPAVAFFIISALFLVIPTLAVPAYQRIFIDDILIAGRDHWLNPLLTAMAITAMLTMALTWLQQYFLLRYQSALALAESSRFFHHILRLPTSFFSQRFGGEIGQRVEINDRIAEVVAEKLSSMTVDILKTLFFGGLMFFYDVRLALLTIGLGMLNFVVLQLVARTRVDNSRRLLKDEGKLMGTAMGGLQMIETIKGTGGEDEFFSRWAGYQAKTLAAKQKLGFISHVSSAMPVLINALTSVAILGMGGWLAMHGNLTMGMLVAFQSIAQNFTKPFTTIVSVSGEIMELQGDMARIDDVMQHEQDPIYHERPLSDIAQRQARLSGLLEMRGVNFGYNPLAKPLIDNLNLTIRPGQRVALVGGSGSGKSTVAKMVAGLYQPWSGGIYFDGVLRQEIPSDFLNNSIAVVDQDVFLFEGTIRDNLTMWDATVPDTRVTQALRDACILDIVSARPGGLASHVEEGGRNFSGGQRQRLEIARALVSEPTFLVLDEATSALDPPTEKQIEKNLLGRGCACLVVAHRLSTIRDCDEIIVMKDGKVAERGTHDEMVLRKKHYYELIQE